jgi:hypothetical protein
MLSRSEAFGLVRLGVDAHTLGISMFSQLLEECGYRVVIADQPVCNAANRLTDVASRQLLCGWIDEQRVTQLGFSYRLDPRDGATRFGKLLHFLRQERKLAEHGGEISGLFFAGLPQTCGLVRAEHGDRVAVFFGDETAGEILQRVGVPEDLIPTHISTEVRYDDARLAFGREIVEAEAYRSNKPVDRSGYPEYGTQSDTLFSRLRHSVEHQLPPLMRAHIGPFLPDRAESNRLFLNWVERLAAAGHLDILSIGSSQLSQSHFGEDWQDRPNGGGVPVNSKQEYLAIRQAAGAMLVRTYSATKNIEYMASVYEETLNMAWHALSLWWFNQMDGRGPLPVYQTLGQHLDAIRYIASVGKPFEANVSHHFSFRGADDLTYILSAYLAAKTAKKMGIRLFVLQNMLNTPSGTWGIVDLAKSRALLGLVGELVDADFNVVHQPRAGLDYFSHDTERAKAQLAAVTALMDDIDPHNHSSPSVIHVVGYSEGSHLADVDVVNESIQITQHSLQEYRRLRSEGRVDDMRANADVVELTAELTAGVRTLIDSIERNIANPYSAEGLYRVFAAGYLPVPYLWECREEFPAAVRWKTRISRGSTRVVGEDGTPVTPGQRAQMAEAMLDASQSNNGALGG